MELWVRLGTPSRKMSNNSGPLPVFEVMPFDHPEFMDGLWSDGELHRRSHRLEFEELWGETVSDEATRRLVRTGGVHSPAHLQLLYNG